MPEPLAPITSQEKCELVIVGGGFTGLWAAMQAKERKPDADIILIEQTFVGNGASGRCGGFLSSTLAHTETNTEYRFGLQAVTANFDSCNGTLYQIYGYRVQSALVVVHWLLFFQFDQQYCRIDKILTRIVEQHVVGLLESWQIRFGKVVVEIVVRLFRKPD